MSATPLTITRDPVAPSQRQRADGATLAVVFAVIVMLVPARLIIKGLPFALTPAEAVGLLAAVWWFCAHLTNTLGAAKGRTPVRTAIYVYGVSLLLTYAYSSAGFLPSRELELADHAVVTSAAMVAIALLACDGVRGRDRIDVVFKALVVAGAIMGLIGAVQYLLNFDLTRFMEFPGTEAQVVGDAILQRNGVNRAASTASHPIEFGVVSVMVLPLALHYAFHARQDGKPALRWWLCCALIAAGMVFSASRSPILGLTVAGAVLLVGWPMARRIRAVVALAGFLVVVKLAVPGLLGAITGLFTNLSSDTSLAYRTNDYDTAFAEIRRHLLLGRGVGTWYAPQHVVFDNQYLLTAVEAGLLGVATFAGLFLTGIWSSLRAMWRAADPSTRDLGLSMTACLVIPLVGSATFDLRAFGIVNGVAFLLVGMAGALLRSQTKEISPPVAPAVAATTPPGGRAG
ncbi:O-antigen ligase family protein [Microbispora sp. RL4-1S]|uniref:O-antigen ligase family protein n=1 Tax=Microbispora oryzae TaxID=2806554 RepID=A0A941ARP0_9ACTN|nr:O-antigen ligase family protein [Microbispora oryzae]